jgi:FtsP/CotA-like multicopper oxidase with cupredoxin domain
MSLFGAFAGFVAVLMFGAGIIATSAFNSSENLRGSGPASSSSGASEGPIAVELGDLFIKPVELAAAAGEVTFEVHNGGGSDHNFAVQGLGKTPMLAPDETFTLELGNVEAGTYEYICEVAGHTDGGMRGTLTVTEGGTEEPAHGDHEAMDGMSPAEMATHDAEVTSSFPAETKGTGGAVLEPEILDDGTKRYELTASVFKWETEPGTVKQAWGYNEMVPGPTLKPELGDRVQVVLHNELPEPTTIHHHGMTLPANMDGVPAISQDAVLPGESFTYEFTVRNTGSNMYHSHFNAQKQVPMGLLGAMVIADEKDPAVDHDMTMILNDGPLGYTLNGKGFPATAPLVVGKGDLIRIRYMNEGLQIHPMHLHGVPQQVIANDGHLLARPYMEDTVMVAPGDRIDVLVRASEAGTWAWHCHILNHAESEDGMFGMVTAMVVEG